MSEASQLESLRRLSAGLAHDLNNVLGGISGLASASLLEVKDGAVAEDLRQIIKTAKEGLMLASRLHLLGLSRHPKRGRLLVNDLLEWALRDLGAPEGAVSCLAPEGLSFLGDSKLLKEALVALAKNALEATEGKGPIRLSASLVGQEILFEVVDQAHALATDRGDLKEPYLSTRSEGRGRGLGLTIAWAVAQGHGGSLTLSSNDQETIAKLSIPLGLPEEEARVELLPKAVSVKEKRTRTILLADDERPMRQATERLLTRAGYRVFSAADGEEAVQLFLAHQAEIDLALIDLSMPKRDGWDTLRAIRAIAPKIPALMMSAFEGEDLQERMRAEGVLGYVEKPFEREAFLSLLRQTLGDSKE